MTSPQAAARYLHEHTSSLSGRTKMVYNPLNKPVEELPFIIGFNNGGQYDWLEAIAVSEDGHFLGSHICSHELYMENDLGILEGTRPDRHADSYSKHYPEGYRMDFVPWNKLKDHELLNKALKLFDERAKSLDAATEVQPPIQIETTGE